jgi:excisionase family DNA binding protein
MSILLTSRQAAEAMSLSPSYVFKLTQQGKIPAVRIGRAVRYRPEDLQAFAAKRTRCA